MVKVVAIISLKARGEIKLSCWEVVEGLEPGT